MKGIIAAEALLGAIAVGAAIVVARKVAGALADLSVLKAGLDAAKAAGQAVAVAEQAGVEAGVREWKNPACADPNDPDCVKRAPGPPALYDEQCYPLKRNPVTGDFERVGPQEPGCLS